MKVSIEFDQHKTFKTLKEAEEFVAMFAPTCKKPDFVELVRADETVHKWLWFTNSKPKGSENLQH